MTTVRVPATTANLGPGFDCFGLALSLHNRLTFEETDHGHTFTGVEPQYRNPENLAIRAYDAAIAAMGLPRCGLNLTIRTLIPVSRGLGSSASLIVAGIVAANAKHHNPLTTSQMLDLATSIEGHPDNVAPALLGGLCVSMMEDSHVTSLPSPLSPSIRICVLIPDFELSTSQARGVLPETVPFADAVFNASRSAVLLKALETGDFQAIRASMQDRLHQSFRYPLIPDSQQLKALAESCQADAFCISGAGPTLLCLHHDPTFPERIRTAIQTSQENQTISSRWTVVPLSIDTDGATMENPTTGTPMRESDEATAGNPAEGVNYKE